MMRLFGGGRYANITSTMALVVALGGTSYAAIKLPANSVGPKQIKSNAVTSGKVKNGSLRSQDFKAGQIPAGATGATGEPTFINTCQNLDTLNFNSAGFYKDAFGIVHLKGIVGSCPAAPIFVLPVGYRPAKQERIATTNGSGAFQEVAVIGNGQVSKNTGPFPGPISLDGITFKAAG